MDDDEIPDLVEVCQSGGNTGILRDGLERKVPITIITGRDGSPGQVLCGID